MDDVADETRYALYTFIQESKKPRSVIEREAMKGLDPKSAMIRWQQLQDRLNAEERPPHMAGRHQRMLQ
jgi:hypothetical protein